MTGHCRSTRRSRIDVTGKGYLPGYTTGNTTVGGVHGRSGGSYGGGRRPDSGATNAVYGDYADPDDWGQRRRLASYDCADRGGGLVRITAGNSALDGASLADGQTGAGSGRQGSTVGGGDAVGGGTIRAMEGRNGAAAAAGSPSTPADLRASTQQYHRATAAGRRARHGLSARPRRAERHSDHRCVADTVRRSHSPGPSRAGHLQRSPTPW